MSVFSFSENDQLPDFQGVSLCIDKRDVLIAWVIIHGYNYHARLLPPEPLVVNQPQSTQVEGADIVMKSSESKYLSLGPKRSATSKSVERRCLACAKKVVGANSKR
jgi:hypothetical protein